MDELKPCPFCGGVAEVTHMQHRFYTDVEWWWVGCTNDKCPAQPFEGITFDSEQEATDAWNTRAERTCKRFWTGAEMICSSCAHQLNKIARYCPNCGAKVVE